MPLLEKTALGVHDFGEDAGAANVVKLGGNFLIAAAIQSLSEVGGCLENPQRTKTVTEHVTEQVDSR